MEKLFIIKKIKSWWITTNNFLTFIEEQKVKCQERFIFAKF